MEGVRPVGMTLEDNAANRALLKQEAERVDNFALISLNVDLDE